MAGSQRSWGSGAPPPQAEAEWTLSVDRWDEEAGTGRGLRRPAWRTGQVHPCHLSQRGWSFGRSADETHCHGTASGPCHSGGISFQLGQQRLNGRETPARVPESSSRVGCPVR